MKRLNFEVNLKYFPRVLIAGALLSLAFLSPGPASAQTNSPASSNLLSLITRPLSLVDALNIALQQNATNINARHDVEASHGIVIQTRAIVLPSLQASGTVQRQDQGLAGTFGNNTALPRDSWNTGIQIVQSMYEGGRMSSSVRTARLTKEQALLDYQTSVEDTLLATRVAYYDVLVATQQIVVNEASVNLLTRELEDQKRRYDAGTVPRFNVLR